MLSRLVDREVFEKESMWNAGMAAESASLVGMIHRRFARLP